MSKFAKIRFPDKVFLFCMAIEASSIMKIPIRTCYRGFKELVQEETDKFVQIHPEARYYELKVESKLSDTSLQSTTMLIKIVEKRHENKIERKKHIEDI